MAHTGEYASEQAHLSNEGAVYPSSVTACVSTAASTLMVGFKPDGNSHGSYVSIVIS